MIDGPTATLIAAVLVATVGMAGFMSFVYYRLGKLEGIVQGLDGKLEQGLADSRELTLSVSRHLSEKMDTNFARLSEKMDTDISHQSEKMDTDISRLSEKVDTEISHLSEKMDAQHAETMAAIQRLTDAFLSHSHDDDGNVMFRIPPGGSTD